MIGAGQAVALGHFAAVEQLGALVGAGVEEDVGLPVLVTGNQQRHAIAIVRDRAARFGDAGGNLRLDGDLLLYTNCKKFPDGMPCPLNATTPIVGKPIFLPMGVTCQDYAPDEN